MNYLKFKDTKRVVAANMTDEEQSRLKEQVMALEPVLQEKLESLNLMFVNGSIYNVKSMPLNHLPAKEKGVDIWNEIVGLVYDNVPNYLNNDMFTECGSWRKKAYGWTIKQTNSAYEFYYKSVDLRFRLRLGASDEKLLKGEEYGGRNAFFFIKQELKKDGINLEDYAIKNGEEVKATIAKPYIDTSRAACLDYAYKHAHHLDFHSAYASALSELHPEMRPTYDRLFALRAQSPELKQKIKSVFTNSIGFFQSKYCCGKVEGERCNYAYANLSKDAIEWTLHQIIDISTKLKANGYMPLLFNTDGIWYAKLNDEGDSVPSEPFTNDARYGKGLRTFGNDHLDCLLRIKSKGSYEFIEDGKYHPVVRGLTRLDKIKPREEWQWGDIYKNDCKVVMIEITPEARLVITEE